VKAPAITSGATRTGPLVTTGATLVTLCLIGVAAITGLLPGIVPQDRSGAPRAETARAAAKNNCAVCGTVESIRTFELRSEAGGAGAAGGGVSGAVVGNRTGGGNGSTAMTILGLAGAAIAGNEIEKNVKKRYAYRVTVRMDDGSFRTISLSSPPTLAVGDKVRVVEGKLVRT